MRTAETFLERIQRAGADVAEHHAQRPQRQQRQRAALPGMGGRFGADGGHSGQGSWTVAGGRVPAACAAGQRAVLVWGLASECRARTWACRCGSHRHPGGTSAASMQDMSLTGSGSDMNFRRRTRV